jgi:hypothetical protein
MVGAVEGRAIPERGLDCVSYLMANMRTHMNEPGHVGIEMRAGASTGDRSFLLEGSVPSQRNTISQVN